MTEIANRIHQIQEELNTLPSGYISKKNIGGKERYYYQWVENGKLKSKYIKIPDVPAVMAKVELRKKLQAELKSLKETPDGVQESHLRRKVTRNMVNITGDVMLQDTVVARVKNGVITELDERLVPLYLKRTGSVEGWLASRAIDSHRTNSRLIKKALRIHAADDAQVALAVNAATITDRYWFRPEGSEEKYADVLFKENYFDTLALRGDPNGFSHRPSRTPELTNTGSFEKCWRLHDGKWWMYKSGNQNEYFSELFICRLGEKMGLPMAHYEMMDGYIRSLDFTDGTKYNFEPFSAVIGENDDYNDCFNVIYAFSPSLAEQYLKIIWMDSVCFNMDRHTENFGFLRDVETGEIVSMAPNYDNNIALIARGYPVTADREHDGLIRFFREFVNQNPNAKEMLQNMEIPEITESMIDECFEEIPIEVDRSFVKAFILNGQTVVNRIIKKEITLDKKETLSLDHHL